VSSPAQAPAQQPPDAQASQAGLAVALGLALAVLWPNLDLANLRRDLPAFKAAVAQQVQRYAAASATLAARQYAQQRKAAVGGGFSPRPVDPPPVEQVAQAVDWAAQPLWAADVLAQPPTEAGSTAIADAKARLAASSERLVLDAGRNTIIDNAQRDRQAKGWARVPEPGACSFCLMLATRGAVYRSEGTADFKSHDNCRCHVEPVFTAYEPPARVREAEALWVSSTRGKSGNAARIAFRQAVEGRTPAQQ
jgi:hypothetical protein